MKLLKIIVLTFLILFSLNFSSPVLAEDKNIPNLWTTSGIIPKLQKTPNDPELFNNFVYPMWGSVCQRYTYTVTYKDKEGRKPEYMRIIFNGKPIDLEKQNPNDNDYKNGVQYFYKFVPNKLGSNFYYFEASNGLGKARASIIDSPDNGPVLFESAFNKNEIAVIGSKTGQKILSYPVKEEWVGGVALSDDGRYLAAKTSRHIYFFDLNSSKEPKWIYAHDQNNEIGGDLKGGIDISSNGSKIIASIAESTLLFDSSSNKPLWRYDQVGNAYNVAISKDGKYMAAGTGGTESNTNSNLLILWNEKSNKPLWQYHSSGNFHDVSLSDDGEYVVGATGCPDRRFYVFSRDSNTPLVQSEMLTRDSPVHRAKISADGSLAAVGSESDAGAVFLFKTNSKEPVWKFPTQNGSSVRALNFTPDGKFIGAATFGGSAYIFDNKSNQPVSSWIVNNTALGGIDISDDGSFIAAGGTDKKLHIFEKGTQAGKDVTFDEYVEEVDISANGKYIAAGTGGSVYFFESINNSDKTFPCTTIIEPKPRDDTMGGAGTGQKATTSLCGDGKCEGPETIDNCKQDCEPNSKTTEIKLPGMLFGFGFLGSTLLLGIFTALRKLKFLEKQKLTLMRINVSKLSFLRLTGKKVTIAFIILTTLFLILTITAVLFNNKSPDAKLLNKGEQVKLAPGKVIKNENQDAVVNQGETKSGCGNTICEPISGETKESCPKDCSAQ